MPKLTAKFADSCTFVIQPTVSIPIGSNPGKAKYRRKLERLVRNKVTNQLLEKSLIDNIESHLSYRNSLPILFSIEK